MLTISKTPPQSLPRKTTTPDSDAEPCTSSTTVNRFECRTCPYQYILDKRYFDRKEFPARATQQAAADDVLGGREQWDNVDRTDAKCPNEFCPGTRAYFYQVQIRSADEPMTSFFRCCECAREWREG